MALWLFTDVVGVPSIRTGPRIGHDEAVVTTAIVRVLCASFWGWEGYFLPL